MRKVLPIFEKNTLDVYFITHFEYFSTSAQIYKYHAFKYIFSLLCAIPLVRNVRLVQ